MSTSSELSTKLVWMDLEMTGLDPEKDTIIETSVVISEGNLENLIHGPSFVIHVDEARLNAMDEWNRTQHSKSGLWTAVLSSTVTLQQAETATLNFIKQHLPPGEGQLAGNSIWQDRRFIRRYMPTLDQYLHYRMVDVSTIKELARRWYPAIPAFEAKAGNHRAVDDIVESIRELQYYRDKVFQPPKP